jgi:tetratricopeptide (TPR) repeat protein
LIAGLEQSSELTLVRLEPNFETDDLQEFGRALGVSVLAIAQVDSSDDSTHIEMQLLNIVLDETSWSRSYDWKPSQTLDISWTIANDLLEEMGLTVMSREKFAGTDDMEAWELLLSGKEYASVLEVKSLDLAIANFQAAIDLDPDFVRGHIGLALAIHELLDISMLAGEEIQALEERAALAASVARNLDRNSADTMYLLGLGASNPQVRIQAFERAIELDPDHDPSYYRYALQMKQNGNLEEAEQLIKRAARLRPMSKRYREELADILELKGKPE